MNKLASIILEDSTNSLYNIDFSGLKNKSILITGASGLVGTYFLAGLSNILKNNDFKIITYAVCQSSPEDYWKEIVDSFDCKILMGDLCDDKFLSTLPQVDIIIHSAGHGQPGKFLSSPIKTLKLNTSTTLLLLEKLNPTGKFLFISTSEVYSGLKNPPFKENQIGNTNTDHPRSCYIEAKRSGEAIMFAARNQGIDAKSARLSLAYGPGTKKDDARVLNSFISKAILSKRIEMMDGGEVLRTYCYITDAIKIMWNILLSGKEHIYNVGGISKISIADLARNVGDLLDVPVIIPTKSGQALSGAPSEVVLDLFKIKNEFSINEFISLEEGLEKTISWQKELYNL